MSQKKLRIIYRDGTESQHYVDDYMIKDGCLCVYVRFGVEAGTKHIPLDLIKKYITY